MVTGRLVRVGLNYYRDCTRSTHKYPLRMGEVRKARCHDADHVAVHTTAVTTRAACWKQAGRPLQGTAFPSPWTGSSPLVGWGRLVQHRMKRSWHPFSTVAHLCVMCFLVLFCSSGRSLCRGPALPHMFAFPTHRFLFVLSPPLPTLPRWRYMMPRRARSCDSFAGGALFWAFCHIPYTTAVTTRAARW